jgi:hypothetical protein
LKGPAGLPEKDYMECPRSSADVVLTGRHENAETPANGAPDHQPAAIALGPRRILGARPDRPLRCVSSGYLSHGCSCDATVPFTVVAAAWSRRLEDCSERGEGAFFHFAWRDEVWVGFGLSDGTVRGVYCPQHAAERERRCQPALSFR